MLPFLLLLSGLSQLTSAGHHSETSLLQITVPQKIGTNTKDSGASDTNVTYDIKINRKTFTLHLEKQSFLDSNFLVYSYNKSGVLYPDSSFIKGHCFYQGYAGEIPNSVVTLSTCSGLRGLLQFENISYGTEPLESSATYEHIIYQIKNNKSDFSPIARNYSTTQFAAQPFKILVKSEKKSEVLLKRILKIQVIMDKALYDYMGSEVALASEKIVYVFSLINNMFSQLKMTVMLTSLELWSDKNQILTNGDANEMLQKFVSWKEKKLFQRSHDMAYLLIYRDHPNYIGATYHGMACNPKFAAGIALYPKMITLEAFSVILAQLIGISLGLTYKIDIYNCYCPGTICIMNPEAIRSRGVKFFSSCSVDEFKSTVSRPEFECLQNQIVPKVVPQARTGSCGNGAMEEGEQCDCGAVENCIHKKCCDAANCTLIGDAECGTGPCCDRKTCRLSQRGVLCRRSTDLCDFPEYCSGTSEFCTEDMRAADFEMCNNKTTYCFQGICRDRSKQCLELFGKFAESSSYLCAQEVNIQSDIFGNCDGRSCNFVNTLCAKLVCHWKHSQIVPKTDFDIQYTYLDGHVCMSGNLRNSSTPDLTKVWDGTKCDDGRFCDNGQCRLTQDYRNRPNCSSAVKCGGHGLCNTLLNCHCDVGYAPPACEPEPLSPGGSINDGFWIVEGKNVEFLVKRHRASQKKGLLISFYVLLPLLVLIAIVALQWNKKKIFWNREDTVSEGSPSEASSSKSDLSCSKSD
ncbi:ADAM metallopeptidase domain 3A (cyritestin 1) precursor [Sus scrofa]|uniref:ADAM3a n=1 Tax=Sus scrofa TaxID=9823 RepID=A5A4F6_PIG|nr:ADAM metallopeptidase domain 3A (cyritestin 1) precursor [Sus scrofa]ABP73258.1 ADAM3a [Sus scrofa]